MTAGFLYTMETVCEIHKLSDWWAMFVPVRSNNKLKCSCFPVVFQIDLMPHDVITQLLRVLAIETKQEKAIINADPTEVALSGLEAFSFDYIVKWPLSLIINR